MRAGFKSSAETVWLKEGGHKWQSEWGGRLSVGVSERERQNATGFFIQKERHRSEVNWTSLVRSVQRCLSICPPESSQKVCLILDHHFHRRCWNTERTFYTFVPNVEPWSLEWERHVRARIYVCGNILNRLRLLFCIGSSCSNTFACKFKNLHLKQNQWHLSENKEIRQSDIIHSLFWLSFVNPSTENSPVLTA